MCCVACRLRRLSGEAGRADRVESLDSSSDGLGGRASGGEPYCWLLVLLFPCCRILRHYSPAPAWVFGPGEWSFQRGHDSSPEPVLRLPRAHSECSLAQTCPPDRDASIGTPGYIVWGRDPVLVMSSNSRSRYIASNPARHDGRPVPTRAGTPLEGDGGTLIRLAVVLAALCMGAQAQSFV